MRYFKVSSGASPDSLNKQRYSMIGSALLSALFIMTLVAIAVTAMTTRLQLDIYRTRLLISNDQLYLSTEAVRFWAINELTSKRKTLLADSNGVIAHFPQQLKTITSGVRTSGELIDLQSKFNINSLIDKKSFLIFINLANFVVPNSKEKANYQLVAAIYDWLTPYQPSHGKDNYLSSYLKQKPPYYPGHQIMRSISEFRLVKGVNQEIYLSLLPYLTALPEIKPININTASKQLLMSMGNGLTEAQALELIEERGDTGIQQLTELSEKLNKWSIAINQLSTESEYYLCIAKTTNDQQNMMVYTVLKKERSKNKKYIVKLISERINTV